jgi:hypothetical protein
VNTGSISTNITTKRLKRLLVICHTKLRITVPQFPRAKEEKEKVILTNLWGKRFKLNN